MPSLSRSGALVLAALTAPVAAAAQTPPPAPAPPAAQPPTQHGQTQQSVNVERNASGVSDKDIQVGVYVNVKADCSSGPLPTIRLVEQPTRGKVNVKSGKVNARNYKQCLALEVPAYVAVYRSEPNFTGMDSFLLEVKYASGRTENQKIKVTITDAASAPAPSTPRALPRPGQPKPQNI